MKLWLRYISFLILFVASCNNKEQTSPLIEKYLSDPAFTKQLPDTTFQNLKGSSINDDNSLFYLLSLASYTSGDIQQNIYTDVLANAEKTKNEALKVEALYCLGSFHSANYNYSSADSIGDLILNSKQPLFRSKGYIIKGSANLLNDIYDTALYYYTAALKESKISNTPILIGKSFMGIAETHRAQVSTNLALQYYDSALLFINNNKFIAADIYASLGDLFLQLLKKDTALKCLDKSILLAKESHNLEIEGFSLTIKADIFRMQDDFAQSLFFYQSALELTEKRQDLASLAYIYSNLGEIYCDQENFKEAYSFFNKSLSICRKINDRDREAFCLSTIASMLRDEGRYQKSVALFSSALKIARSAENTNEEVYCLFNLGETYSEMKNFELAEKYLLESLKDYSLLNCDRLTNSYNSLAQVYLKKNELKKAISLVDSVFKYANQCNLNEDFKNAYYLSYQVNTILKKHKEALEAHLKYTEIKDSLTNISQVRKFNSIEFKAKEKKLNEIQRLNEERFKLEQDKKEQEIKQARLFRNFLFIGIFLIVIVVIIIYRALKSTQKSAKIIEEQKKEISDSINYAKRIQDSFFASEEEFSKTKHEVSVLYIPKDVVSGDFYWAHSNEKDFYLCAADCTGHGIPGAFMSLLCISLLNESVFSKGYSSPNIIFNFIRAVLIKGLKVNESGQGGNDGMDAVLLKITDDYTLSYAAANNPVWILREGAVVEFKADKMPVGRSPVQDRDFTDYTLPLQKNDVIYVFTDGYADQFGGAKGKKFKYKALRELIEKNSSLHLPEQTSLLKEAYLSWKGALDQIDDVCVIAIKIN